MMTRQASQIQVLTLQLEDASCQLDRSCVDVNHPSIGWMPVAPVSESPILLSQKPEGRVALILILISLYYQSWRCG